MPAKLPVARVGSNEEILRAEGEKSPFRGGLVGRNVAAAQERLHPLRAPGITGEVIRMDNGLHLYA